MPFCPKCGKEVQEDFLFCPKCGQNLKPVVAPTQPTPISTYGGVDPDAYTARTLTFVAIILGAIFFVLGLFVSTLFVAARFFMVGFFPAMFGLGFLISIVWIALDYLLVYRNLFSPNDIPSARGPALILGILQLILGGIIPGILLLIAYVKIGDSMRRSGQY